MYICKSSDQSVVEVAETMDLNFSPFTTLENLGTQKLIQEHWEKFGEGGAVKIEAESDEKVKKHYKVEQCPSQLDQDAQVQGKDEGSDDEEGQKVSNLQRSMLPPLPLTADQVIVQRDCDPKALKPCSR